MSNRLKMLDKDGIINVLNNNKKVKNNGCWEWQKSKNRKGYGTISIQGKSYPVHRLSLWLYGNFDLNSEYLVCHHCDNPSCFNPEHLFSGTQQDNCDDKFKKGRNRNLFGEDHAMAKLNNSQVTKIRKRRKYETCTAIAKSFNISVSHVSKICKGEAWNHLLIHS